MNELEMPGPLAGFNVEGDQARAVEIIPGMETTIEVDGRTIRGDIDEPELGIGGERCPG